MAATKKGLMTRNNEIVLASQLEAETEELEIDIVALLYRLIEKLKWIVAAALLGALIAVVVTNSFVTPLYEATSKLYVLNPSDSAIDLTTLNMGDKLAADYVQVFENWHVHEKVISTLNLEYTYKDIQEMLKITIPTGTRIIEITVTSDDPEEAARIAMAYAEFAPAFIEAKMETDRPNVFEEARVPEEPCSPNMIVNVILGFMIAGVLAAVVVVIQFFADDRIRNAELLERRLGLPVLGMMPVQSGEEDQKKAGRGAKR